MPKHQWISEAEMAEKLGYNRRYLRKSAQSGELNITFTSIKGRCFFYDERSLERLLAHNAHISTILIHIKVDPKRFQWIPEEQAAAVLQLSARYLRKLVRSGALPISHTHVNWRNFLYCAKSIDRYLTRNSVDYKTW